MKDNYIKLIGSFYMTADENQYILMQEVERTDSKTQAIKKAYVTKGYYTTVEQLAKACVTLANRQAIANGEIKTFEQCYKQISDIFAELKNILGL